LLFLTLLFCALDKTLACWLGVGCVTVSIVKRSGTWCAWLRAYFVAMAALTGCAVWLTSLEVFAGAHGLGADLLVLFIKALGVVSLLLALGSHLDLAWLLGRRRYPHRYGITSHVTVKHWPGVCFQVPTYDEPPELVIQTIRKLLEQDYAGRWMIQLIDNNTPDPRTWAPVREFCARYPERIEFMHLENWPGYKAGALNEGMRRLPRWVEHVAIVDADYHVVPDFLLRVVSHLSDPSVAYVQTPQSYRQWEPSRFLQSIYYNYDEYFQTRWPPRAESNGIICVGTMAVIRRSAIEAVGVWDGKCVTEDAELSVRLLANGWKGVFDHRPMGFGLMPLDFNSMRKQRFRWALGMIHIFRAHYQVLFGKQNEGRRLTLSQRLSFWGLANQFLSELVPLACAVASGLIAVFAATTGDRAGASVLLILPGAALVLHVWAAAIRAFLTTASSRSRFALFGSVVISFSISWIIAKACLCGFITTNAVFLRTPKVLNDQPWWSGIWAAIGETALAVSMAVLAIWSWQASLPGAALFAALLAVIFGSAPAVSLAYTLRAPRLQERQSCEERTLDDRMAEQETLVPLDELLGSFPQPERMKKEKATASQELDKALSRLE